MAIKPLAELEDFELVNSDQDCRGWTVVDPSGQRAGTVRDMLIDTDRERVAALVLDNGQQIPVRDVALEDEKVILRGAAGTTGAANAGGRARSEDEVVLPVIEEEIHVGKRIVEKGGVGVHSRVTEQPVEETVHLREERVNVERRPADRPVTERDVAALKEGATAVTTRAEEPVIAKDARVVEEVVISKDVTGRDETIRDTVRRTDVEVEDLDREKAKRAKQ